MNELKPEDVMRALEKHSDYENDNCFECPYKDHLSTEVGNCVDHLVRDALALLREKDVIIREFEHQSKIALKRLAEKDAEIERLREIINSTEDDFPNCKISGCEAARKNCHIDCPYGKENTSENS